MLCVKANLLLGRLEAPNGKIGEQPALFTKKRFVDIRFLEIVSAIRLNAVAITTHHSANWYYCDSKHWSFIDLPRNRGLKHL